MILVCIHFNVTGTKRSVFRKTTNVYYFSFTSTDYSEPQEELSFEYVMRLFEVNNIPPSEFSMNFKQYNASIERDNNKCAVPTNTMFEEYCLMLTIMLIVAGELILIIELAMVVYISISNYISRKQLYKTEKKLYMHK